jgi:diguanylate cyclase (GGDEF)-like protein
MKRRIPAFVFLVGCAFVACGAAPVPLTTLQSIHQLSNAEAGQGLPVSFQATVTYFRPYERTLFVQDGDTAIYVLPSVNDKIAPGDRVLIHGTTLPSFRPIVVADRITVLGRGFAVKAQPVTFQQLIGAQFDCKLVTVRGRVLTADVTQNGSFKNSRLELLVSGSSMEAGVDGTDAAVLKGLLDAEVEVTGALSGRFDGKMQQTGLLLHVPSLAQVKVLSPAAIDPNTLAVTPMDEILTGYRVENHSNRIRVHGTVTYYQPGSALVLQSGTKSLWVMTESFFPLNIGDVADVTGFPDVHDGFLTLRDGEVLSRGKQAPLAPVAANWSQLATSKHVFDLTSIEGEVVMAVREPAQDEFVLVSDGHIFSAIYRHPDISDAASAGPMKQIRLGSRVSVTGICILEDSNPFDRNVPFNILMRSAEDLTLVAEPSWLNIGNLIRVVSVLILAVILVGLWGVLLRRKVRHQTAVLSVRIEAEAALERHMAQLEQRRSRILEDINGSRPLAEILEEITELVSFSLNGIPCWCEVTDGARLGTRPPHAALYRLVREQILARNGTVLGVLIVAFDPAQPAVPQEGKALALGARLATLAIETRRLYIDLLHRLEFDLLTDIHNRFSLDKHLDAQIEVARKDASIFGLIYIDLDDFKQVNDVYGHKVGDIYLQEAAQRMKRQLRAQDLLARLGGDEFAVLVGVVRNRAEVEEVALRLERCFDAPFLLEGHRLECTASVGIALYPEDGITKDSLLITADAAMYVRKNTRKLGAALEESDIGSQDRS